MKKSFALKQYRGGVWAGVCVLLGMLLPGPAPGLPMIPPEWSGDPGTVYHYFTFPDDSTTPLPDLSTNAYGGATALVTATNQFATGWQDPDNALRNYGHPDHGAWDLGPDGTIDITVPMGRADLSLEVSVIAMYESGLFDMPTLTLAGGYELANSTVTAPAVDIYAAIEDSGPPHTAWRRITWTGDVYGFEDEALTLRLQSAEGAFTGTIIDTVEVYLIPEPYAAALVLCSLLAAYKIRKRRAIQRIMAAGVVPPRNPGGGASS